VRPGTSSRRDPNSTTPPSTTPSWPPSPPATRPAAASPTTWAASRRISPLHVLEDVGLIRHEPDAFRRNRSSYRIAEPLIAIYHAVVRPHWGDLVTGDLRGIADRHPTVQLVDLHRLYDSG
jgi:hypothetical protein